MPLLHANGVRLSYQRSGSGDQVLMIMGSGASGHVWTTYQTPALNRAGYETIVFDHRGMPPSDAPTERYSLADVVADARGVIEELDLAPCRIVGSSLGATIAQELAIQHPHIVRCAVFVATRARADRARRAQTAAQRTMLEKGIDLPAEYDSVQQVFTMLSPASLNDDDAVSTWLDLFELTHARRQAASGQAWIDTDSDRRERLGAIAAPCRVVAFTDDLITPPHLGAEVAAAIPDCDYVEIADAGHLGHLEKPDEVNAAMIDFLDQH